MTTANSSLPSRVDLLVDEWIGWLNKPLLRWQLALGWVFSTIVFVALSHTSGGPSYGDASETILPALAIAHGHLACAFPTHLPHDVVVLPFAAPLYPFLSAVLAFVVHVGHGVPFPTAAQLGPNCEHAVAAIYAWSTSVPMEPMIAFGYLGWLAVMFGIVAVLRTTSHAMTGWEPVTLALAAASPSVFQCVQTVAHPQDMLAVGLILGALASAFRRRWLLTGVLLGLSFTSQQFAILVIVALVVALPRVARTRMTLGTVASVAAVGSPLMIFDPAGTLRAVLLGSNRLSVLGGDPSTFTGGTWLAALHLHGVVLFFIARALPVLASAGVSWWVSRRLGERILDPLPLLSLIGVALSLRLLFEENIFEYYFMAATIMLLVLMVLRIKWRGLTITWVVAVTLAFSFTIVAYFSADLVMFISIAAVFGLYVVISTIRRGLRWSYAGLLVLLLLTASPTLWGRPMWDQLVPTPVWQLLLTSWALVLAGEPLWTAIHVRDQRSTLHEPPQPVE